MPINPNLSTLNKNERNSSWFWILQIWVSSLQLWNCRKNTTFDFNFVQFFPLIKISTLKFLIQFCAKNYFSFSVNSQTLPPCPPRQQPNGNPSTTGQHQLQNTKDRFNNTKHQIQMGKNFKNVRNWRGFCQQNHASNLIS